MTEGTPLKSVSLERQFNMLEEREIRFALTGKHMNSCFIETTANARKWILSVILDIKDLQVAFVSR